jgi:hypothetical protein
MPNTHFKQFTDPSAAQFTNPGELKAKDLPPAVGLVSLISHDPQRVPTPHDPQGTRDFGMGTGFGDRNLGMGTRDLEIGTRDWGLGDRDFGMGTRDWGLGTWE